nr:MAG TPA: hypothetical protein [Bacteriophage sp.]
MRDASGAFSFPIPIISLKKLTFFHQKQNFFPKIFGGSKYSPYLCHRLTDDSSLSGRATVSPMASCRRLFLCPRVSFSRQREKGVPIWRLHEP